MTKLPLVTIVFRKKNPLFFSIERVFGLVRIFFPPSVQVKLLYLPHHTNGVYGILKNLRFLWKAKSDIYHISGDIHYAAAVLPSKRTILTIHDCSFLYQTHGIKKVFLKWLLLDMPVRRSAVITTISPFTRKQILENTKCSPDKIVIISNPADPEIRFIKKPFNNEKPKILFIGSTPNKNLDRVIEALSGINCELNIVGKPTDTQLEKLSYSQIRFTTSHNLNQAELVKAYTDCDIILFPSTFEGFGLPLLEGFQAGRVVITSDISPLKEIAAGAACLVDPLDINSIREKIVKVIEDNEYRNELINNGFVVAKNYSPEKIASQYYQVYQKVYKDACVG